MRLKSEIRRAFVMATTLACLPSCDLFKPTQPGEAVSSVWVRKALEEAIVHLDRADLDKDGELDAIELGVLTTNLIARAYQLAAEDK